MPKSEQPSVRLAVHVDAVRLLLPYICREATRFYLTGVHFEPHPKKGVLVVATDGHKMGVAYDPGAIVEACPADLVMAVHGITHALKPRSIEELRHVVVEGDTISVRLADSAEAALGSPYLRAACSDSLIDGTFPDWRRVIPSYPAESYAPAAFNAAYIENFATSYAMVAGNDRCAAQISCRSKEDPALLRFSSAPASQVEFFAILMPMLGDTDLDTLPDWFTTTGD